jgi:SAM-dependent methyltransferase
MDEQLRHEQRLARSRNYWDRVSPLMAPLEKAATAVDTYAFDHLSLGAGHRVLDIGCGRGAALPCLRDAVGARGRVLGIDHSPLMLDRAKECIELHGWDNVELRCVDFTRAHVVPDSFDAAIALFSLSAMPDVPAALDVAATALRPGGRLFVADLRLEPGGWATPLIWLAANLYRRRAGSSGIDVLDAARTTFTRVTLTGRSADRSRTRPGGGWPPLTTFVATNPDLSTL